MTEQKIDANYVDQLVRDEALYSLGELCKSLIADGERLDWLENCSTLNTTCHPGGGEWKWTEFDYKADKTLRQAIDDRRGK